MVATGPKWAPWWRFDAASLDLGTWQINQDYVTTFEGFDRPWSLLADLVPDLEVTRDLLRRRLPRLGDPDDALPRRARASARVGAGGRRDELDAVAERDDRGVEHEVEDAGLGTPTP